MTPRSRRGASPVTLLFAVSLLGASLLGGLLAAVVPAVPAAASVQTTIFAATDAQRANAGLPALVSNPTLDSVAQSWAQHMAQTGELEHRPDLAAGVPDGWRSLAENIAAGYRDGDQVVAGWMDSTGHRENILGDSTDLGVGWVVDSSGTSWAVQVFATYPGSGGGPRAASTPAETGQDSGGGSAVAPPAAPPAPAPVVAPPPAPVPAGPDRTAAAFTARLERTAGTTSTAGGPAAATETAGSQDRRSASADLAADPASAVSRPSSLALLGGILLSISLAIFAAVVSARRTSGRRHLHRA